MHLFTYGTLMFPEVWQAVVGRQFETTPAQLPGYEIYRVAGALYPGIIAVNPSPYGRGQVRDFSGSQPSAISSQPSSSSSSDSRPSTLDSGLSPIPGLLYHNLDEDSLARLDAFEGHEYIRQSVTVLTDAGQQLPADAYIIPPNRRDILTGEIWTAEDFATRGDLAHFIAKYAGFTHFN
jgi:gamma-glutamylcyclotransferase (GGCT)/AIG2-like uncharacterized protein YtfP